MAGVGGVEGLGLEDDEGLWGFARAVGEGDADDGGVDDLWVGEQDGFEFGGGDLPAVVFDYILAWGLGFNGRYGEGEEGEGLPFCGLRCTICL